jgi:bacterioferritin
MTNQNFSIDVAAIADHARQQLANGPVTADFGKEADRVIEVLNDVVATEIVCWLRYSQHAIVAEGLNREPVSKKFTEHAAEERDHMVRAADRVNQLGGQPDMDPGHASGRAHTSYETYDDEDLTGMLRENLKAERIVIEIYRELIRWLGDDDPTTRILIEGILAEEEEHADDLNDFLGSAAAG